MSLAIAWIDKIFLKMTLNYGVDFMARYKGLNPMDVKTDWAHELGFCEQRPSAIKFALENLPDRVPTAQQFKALCLTAPHNEAPAALTHEPKADPAKVAEAFKKLEPLRGAALASSRGDWALVILQRHADGCKVSPTVVQMAKEGLRNMGITMPTDNQKSLGVNHK